MKRIVSFSLLYLTWLSPVFSQVKGTISGEALYKNNCLACHQADGMGVIGMNPPLSKTQWVIGDKKVLIGILLKGMKQELEIGDEYYSNPMPAQSHLSDAEMAAVLTYVRSHFGNQASAVSTAEVKQVRERK